VVLAANLGSGADDPRPAAPGVDRPCGRQPARRPRSPPGAGRCRLLRRQGRPRRPGRRRRLCDRRQAQHRGLAGGRCARRGRLGRLLRHARRPSCRVRLRAWRMARGHPHRGPPGARRPGRAASRSPAVGGDARSAPTSSPSPWAANRETSTPTASSAPTSTPARR